MSLINKESTPPLPSSLAEHAYQHLREAVLSGRLAAGAALRQEKLSRELGISRLPLREALRQLDTEGLIVLKPRRGYFVAVRDTAEIEELFDIREILEARAARIATIQRTNEDISEIEDLLKELDAIAFRRTDTAGDFARVNRQFHQRFAASSHRPHLCRLLGSVHDSLEPYIRISEGVESMEKSQEDHHRLFAALKAGDGELTERLCREHCERSSARLLMILASESAQASSSDEGDYEDAV